MEATIKKTFRLRINKDRAYRYWVLQELNRRQTADERADKTTRWRNHVGFSMADPAALTPLAEKILEGRKLSSNEERVLKKKLPKYWEQFTETTLAEPPDSPTTGTTAKKPPGTKASPVSGSGRRAA
jgi:hypothetical protein